MLTASPIGCSHAETGEAGSHRQNRRWDPEAVRWVGSKGGEGVWQRIISEMPPHGHYIEAFAGKAVIAARKRPALRTTLIDADKDAPGLALAATLPHGEAIVGDALEHLRNWRKNGWFSKFELVYCDPPYLGEVRSCDRDYYRHEMKGEGEHTDLLWLLRSLPCYVIVSGYWSQVYEQVLHDWRTVKIPTVKRNGEPAVEWLWCNFDVPTELHDHRWYGVDFRHREQVNRKRRRMVRKLLSLPPVELSAVLADLSEARSKKGKQP